MRCSDCNKFVSFDDSNEPEADDADIDAEGRVSGTVRVYLTCAECGTELKEASFDLDVDMTEVVAAHLKTMKTSRTEGKGRGLKTFYGYHATLHVKCSCGHEFGDEEHSDDMQASHMDELS